MANPVFANSGTFNGGPARQQANFQQYGTPTNYAQPQGFPPPGYQQPYQPQAPVGGVMTLDDVIAKSAITLLVVFAAAAATFMLMPLALLSPALIVSAIVGFVTVLVVGRRQRIPVGGVMFYAAVEGVFVGAFSKFMEFMYPGIVVTAVFATFVAAAATLAAYKFFNIRVTPKMRKMVFIGTAALAGVYLVNLVLSLFNVNLGIVQVGSGAGWLSIAISVLAVGLAVFNLITDFDYIERGIASQAPAHESWRAAFGITVTMVWLYIEILRIVSYFRD